MWIHSHQILNGQEPFVDFKLNSHYEKSCPSKPHYFTIRTPKELIYNYIIIKTWKK
jgi:hypothetical protein